MSQFVFSNCKTELESSGCSTVTKFIDFKFRLLYWLFRGFFVTLLIWVDMGLIDLERERRKEKVPLGIFMLPAVTPFASTQISHKRQLT